MRAYYTARFKLEAVRYAQELGNRVMEGKFDVRVGEMNIRWSGEEEKPPGISKKKCALVVEKVQVFTCEEAKLYLCIMNTGRNRYAVYMEILQVKGCRLARKHNTYICY